jgi:quercetin dioxygenase-like cupin family protein
MPRRVFVSEIWVKRDGAWALVVKGRARLRIEGEAQDRELGEGDFVLLPAHCRHRVTWTEQDVPTVWLAVHFAAKTYVEPMSV